MSEEEYQPRTRSGRSGKSGQRRSVPYDPTWTQWGPAAGTHFDPHDLPDQEDSDDYLLASTIATIMSTLPRAQREAIELIVFNQHSHAHAGWLMGMSDKTATKHLREGLIAVARRLNDPIVEALIGHRLPTKSPMQVAMQELLDELGGVA